MAQFMNPRTLFPNIEDMPTQVLPVVHLDPLFIQGHTPTLTSMQALGYEFRGAEHNDGYLTLPMLPVVELEALPTSAWEVRSTSYVHYIPQDLF